MSTHVTVYRKPTHRDQYLNFQSNHHLKHKCSAVRTLLNSAQNLLTTMEGRKEETEHVKVALWVNDYQDCMFKIPKSKKHQPTTNKGPKQQKDMPSVALPYIRGLFEQITSIFRNHGVGTYHKPFTTIRSVVVNPKVETPDLKKCGSCL